jgi:hypothetical protein
VASAQITFDDFMLTAFVQFWMINNFGLTPFADFKFKFKVLISAFLNSNSKCQIFNITVRSSRGAQYLIGESLKVVWAEFSTLS